MDPWLPEGQEEMDPMDTHCVVLQINMNDMETGVGNGIYYMDIGKKVGPN